MRLQRNSKLNGFERKIKEIVCFSLKTIEFTVALRLHLYFACAALLAGLGWARAGGRAGLGQDWRPTAGAALGRARAGGRAGLGQDSGGAALAADSELVRAGLVRRLGWSSGWWAGCLGWAGAGGQWAGLACGLRWRLSASWCALGLAGGFWASGWSVAGGPAACHGVALPVGRQQGWAGAGGQWAGLLWASCAHGCWPVQAGLCKLVGQLGWTGGWLVPTGGRRGPALIFGLSHRVEAGVAGWASRPFDAKCLLTNTNKYL